jgi:hypothetical protein
VTFLEGKATPNFAFAAHSISKNAWVRRLAGGSPQPSLCTHGRFLPGTRMANWRHKTCIQKRIALGLLQLHFKACC